MQATNHSIINSQIFSDFFSSENTNKNLLLLLVK